MSERRANATWTQAVTLSTFDDVRHLGCIYPAGSRGSGAKLRRVPPSGCFPLPKAWSDLELENYPDEYAVFEDAIVTGAGAFIVGDRLFNRDVFFPTGANSGRHPDNIGLYLKEYFPRHEAGKFILESTKIPASSKGTHFLLMDNNRGNFWHFIHDCLTKFLILDGLPEHLQHNISIIRQKNKLDMQNFLLPHFVKDRKTLSVGRGDLLRVERLVVPARANGLTGFSISAMHFVRNKLLEISDDLFATDLDSADARRPTYISRRGARSNQGREIYNIDELERILALYDFRFVKLEDISPVDQIKIMRETSTLLGVHGAGLANQFFLNRGSNVVEITGAPRGGQPQTPDLMTRDSQIFGLGGYVSVPYHIKDKIFVDTKKVVEILERINRGR
jgi:hypothetical protein